MKRKVRLLPMARRDVEGAFRWYEGQRKGLGYDFLLSFEATVEGLRRLPEGHELVALRTRKVLLRRFPYVVLYALGENHLLVTAVFHAHRDPRRWSDRVREEGSPVDEARFEHRLENDPRLLACVAGARGSLRAVRGVGLEEVEA